MLRPALLAALLLAAPAALAQESDKPWRLHEALVAPDWLSVSGSVRPRYEYVSNPFTAGRIEDDVTTSVQSTLAAEVRHGDFALSGELLDARVLDQDGPAAAATIDTLEIVNAYVAWRPKHVGAQGATLDVNAGRFTQDIGSRRLIARSGFQNTLQAFEGVRGVWKNRQGVQVNGFMMTPLARMPADIPSQLDNKVEDNLTPDDVTLSGLHAQAPLKAFPGGEATVEGYVIDLKEEDQADLPSRNRDLTTWGARLRRAPKAKVLDFDIEFAKQTGTSRATTSPADLIDLDHDAHMLHAEAGYTFDAPWSPRLSLSYDFGSGDKSPADREAQRFDPLFGDRSFDLGPTGTFGFILRSNVKSPGMRIEAAPDKMQDLMAQVRGVTLDQPRDSFSTSNVRDTTGASGDDVGTLLELRYRRWLLKDSLRLQVGGVFISQGDFLERAPNRSGLGDPAYSYAMVTWTF